MTKIIFRKILLLIVLVTIVLFFYFIIQTCVFKIVMLFTYILHILYETYISLISYFTSLYHASENYYILSTFLNKLRITTSTKHLLNDLNYTKVWVDLYLYPKYIYGTFHINKAIHYVLDWHPVWCFGVYDFSIPPYGLIPKQLDAQGLKFEIPFPQLLDCYWGSYRWKVTEGDLSLIPDWHYGRMFKRFVKRVLKWSYFFTSNYIYIPVRSINDFYPHVYILATFESSFFYVYACFFKYIHYKYLTTLFFWVFIIQIFTNLNIFYRYLIAYPYGAQIYKTRYYFVSFLFLFIYLYIFTIGFVNFLYISILIFIVVYLLCVRLFKHPFRYFQARLLKTSIIFLRQHLLILKKAPKKKLKKTKKHQFQKDPMVKFLFRLYSFLLKSHRNFSGYSPHYYYTKLRQYKKFRKFNRWQNFVDLWDYTKTPFMVNPHYYSDLCLPSSLKGSRGGIWLRTTHKDYAKHFMYENTDALRFFHQNDVWKYYIWEPASEYGLQFFNPRFLILSNSENFFNYFFNGVRQVFTDSPNKSFVIGGLSHYDIFRSQFIPYDVSSFIKKSKSALIFRSMTLIWYHYYIILNYIFINNIYKVYFYFLEKLRYVSFFFSEFLKFNIESTMDDVDPDYAHYGKFIEFYKLSAYKNFEYYLPKRSPYLFCDNSRSSNIYFLKKVDGWIIRHKIFEPTSSSYSLANGGLQQSLLSVSTFAVLKMSKWSLFFYNHFSFEFVLFAVVSLISKVWFFHRFFTLFDDYLYQIAYSAIHRNRRFAVRSLKFRVHHYFLRSRWKRNKQVRRHLAHAQHLHTRDSHYDFINIF